MKRGDLLRLKRSEAADVVLRVMVVRSLADDPVRAYVAYVYRYPNRRSEINQPSASRRIRPASQQAHCGLHMSPAHRVREDRDLTTAKTAKPA